MAGSSGQTSGIKSFVYLDTDIPSPNATYANLSALIEAGNLVPKVAEVGAFDREGNPVPFGSLGEESEQSVAGQTSAARFSFTLNIDNSNARHQAIQGYSIGQAVAIAVNTKTGDDNQTADYIDGEILSFSKTTSLGSVQQLVVGVAVKTMRIGLNKA